MNKLKSLFLKIKQYLDRIKKYYIDSKSKINIEIGKKIFKITKVFFWLFFLLIMPILMITLSTLMGSGIIISSAYYGTMYASFVILFIILLTLLFFKEFKNK